MSKIITIVLIILSLHMSAQCWQSISAGDDHSLAIKSDGTLWAWGDNTYGQLGDNTSTAKNIPTQIGAANDWVKISAGNSISLALKSDGTLWAWGRNIFGQVGNGTTSTTNVSEPIQVGTATNWKSISAGTQHCMALKTDGTVWTWGRNNFGQLGDNTTVDKTSPTQIGTNWKSIATGAYHCLAIKNDGTLWAWGWNFGGSLGDGTAVQKNIPTQIGTANDWQKIESGNYHSLGIKTNGTLWTWGSNANGELGNGTTSSKYTPTQIGTDTNWLNVIGGYRFTFGIKSDFSLWSWGKNDSGQLGNGTSGVTNTLVPTQIGLSSDTSEISLGYGFVLEKNSSGFLRACGENASGQLGDGANVNKNILGTITCNGSLSTENISLHSVKVYPNPVKDILNLSYDKKITSVAIYNLAGQQIFTKEIHANESKIDTSDLAVGTYLVMITSGHEVKKVKIIKK